MVGNRFSRYFGLSFRRILVFLVGLVSSRHSWVDGASRRASSVEKLVKGRNRIRFPLTVLVIRRII